jgi:hypothetical protein
MATTTKTKFCTSIFPPPFKRLFSSINSDEVKKFSKIGENWWKSDSRTGIDV